jgi:DNA repair photolyase
MSVATVDMDAWERLEPGTAPPAQRLRAVKELAAAGIDTGVLMMPLVPGITTSRDSIARTVEAIAAAGVRLVAANVAHLEPGVREYFFEFLAREYPDLVAGYERLYRSSYASRDYTTAVQEVVAEARERCRAKAAVPTGFV